MAVPSISISLTHFRFIRMVICTFIFVMLSIPVAQAKPGFWTGAAVGYLFGNVDHRQTINNIGFDLPYEDHLYQEYKRNEGIIKDVDVNQEMLVLRNQQIAKELIKRAQNNYIKAFSLKLTPVTREVVEKQSARNSEIFSTIKRFFYKHQISAKSFDAHRDRIRYAISFDENSPQSIADFDILTVNGHPAEKNGQAWFYTYAEQWGANAIVVEFQNRLYPELRFTLKEWWNVPTAEQAKFKENSVVAQAELDEFLKFLLMLSPILLVGVCMYIFLNSPEL